MSQNALQDLFELYPELREIPFISPIYGAMGGTSCPVSPPPPPPAIPSLVSSPAGAVPGSVWVQGTDLRYIASGGGMYTGTGTSVSAPAGAIVGSMWLQSADDTVRYIDASGTHRALQATSLGAKTAGAITGSFQIDTAQAAAKSFVWYGATNKIQWWNGFVFAFAAFMGALHVIPWA